LRKRLRGEFRGFIRQQHGCNDAGAAFNTGDNP